jgi:hypothetical protein
VGCLSSCPGLEAPARATNQDGVAEDHGLQHGERVSAADVIAVGRAEVSPTRTLDVYLDEFVFRHHRRRTPMAAFQTLLGLGTLHPPTTYEQITTHAA